MKLKIFLDELNFYSSMFGDKTILFYIFNDKNCCNNQIRNATVLYDDSLNVVKISLDSSIFCHNKYTINDFVKQIKFYKTINDSTDLLFEYYGKKLTAEEIVFSSISGYGCNDFNLKMFYIKFYTIG